MPQPRKKGVSALGIRRAASEEGGAASKGQPDKGPKAFSPALPVAGPKPLPPVKPVGRTSAGPPTWSLGTSPVYLFPILGEKPLRTRSPGPRSVHMEKVLSRRKNELTRFSKNAEVNPEHRFPES